MRLDKYLAHAGLGTRREVKDLIRAGRISIDGKVAKNEALTISEEDAKVFLDNQLVVYSAYHFLLLNKPEGYLSATEDADCPTVLDLIEDHARFDLFPVGRLDKDTTGLLLLTNHGKLAHRLLSPRHHVEKEYSVTLARPLREELVEEFHKGVVLDDGYKCLPAELIMEDETHARIIIKEGKFHQIKRMFEAYGNMVVALKRIRMSFLTLEDLPVGKYRRLTDEEVRKLLAFLPKRY